MFTELKAGAARPAGDGEGLPQRAVREHGARGLGVVQQHGFVLQPDLLQALLELTRPRRRCGA